jgi:hypothetical protein
LPFSAEKFAPQIQSLVRKFESDKGYYLSKGYPEAQARVDFITPFFKALGWDVENEARLPHHAREVIVERGESETTGRPDYTFRIAGSASLLWRAKPTPCRSTPPETSCSPSAARDIRRKVPVVPSVFPCVVALTLSSSTVACAQVLPGYVLKADPGPNCTGPLS